VVALAALAALVVLPGLASEPSAESTSVARPPSTTVPSRNLAEGVRVEIQKGKAPSVLTATPAHVSIKQGYGVVRYLVDPSGHKTVQVSAGPVLIRVIGTEFVVSVGQDDTSIQVEQGRVSVSRSSGIVILSPGERLEVPTGAPATWPPPSPAASATAEAEERLEEPMPTSPRPSASAPGPKALFQQADEARRSGRSAQAAALLRELISTYPRSPRVATALFTLGRIERNQGHHAAAAAAFEQCYQIASKGPLGEDALAEAAAAHAAGGGARSQQLAREYLQRFPKGIHAPRMERLAR